MSDKTFKVLAPRIMGDLLRDFPQLDVNDAAAIVGNAGHESGGLTSLQEISPTVAGSRGGYGWFQWTGPRRREFEAWCRSHNLKLSSYEANYGFLVYELRGSESGAMAALHRASSLYAKVVNFESAYERAGVKAYPSRMRYAQMALDAYNGKPAASDKKTVEVGPLKKSRTVAGGSAATIGGAVVVAKEAQDQLQQAQDSFTAGNVIGYAIGALIIVGGLLALYARWDMAGRPLPWRAS